MTSGIPASFSPDQMSVMRSIMGVDRNRIPPRRARPRRQVSIAKLYDAAPVPGARVRPDRQHPLKLRTGLRAGWEYSDLDARGAGPTHRPVGERFAVFSAGGAGSRTALLADS